MQYDKLTSAYCHQAYYLSHTDKALLSQLRT